MLKRRELAQHELNLVTAIKQNTIFTLWIIQRNKLEFSCEDEQIDWMS